MPIEKLTDPIAYPAMAMLIAELRELGYVEGSNLSITRFSGGGVIERRPDLARDVVRSRPDAIVAVGLVMAQPLKVATDTIPILVITGDPVAGELVTNLSRPGGNVTGVAMDGGIEVWAKRVELLRTVIPAVSKLAMPGLIDDWDIPYVRAIRQVVQGAGVSLVPAALRSPAEESEYRRALAALRNERVDAILVADSPDDYTYLRLIIQLIEDLRLPAIYPWRTFVELGGLMAYSVDGGDLMRHAARQVDQILKGARPGEIPFYQATKFQTVINLRAARVLGLTIPPSLLARADEVIE
jgi:putative ABC transport system substrate-binding protein